MQRYVSQVVASACQELMGRSFVCLSRRFGGSSVAARLRCRCFWIFLSGLPQSGLPMRIPQFSLL